MQFMYVNLWLIFDIWCARRARQWMTNCGRQDLFQVPAVYLTTVMRICSFHFQPEMFCDAKLRSRLQRCAVPTLFNLKLIKVCNTAAALPVGSQQIAINDTARQLVGSQQIAVNDTAKQPVGSQQIAINDTAKQPVGCFPTAHLIIVCESVVSRPRWLNG